MIELKDIAQKAIGDKGIPLRTIAELSGVDRRTLSRFVKTGKGNIETVEAIFATLGYELIPVKIER